MFNFTSKLRYIENTKSKLRYIKKLFSKQSIELLIKKILNLKKILCFVSYIKVLKTILVFEGTMYLKTKRKMFSVISFLFINILKNFFNERYGCCLFKNIIFSSRNNLLPPFLPIFNDPKKFKVKLSYQTNF